MSKTRLGLRVVLILIMTVLAVIVVRMNHLVPRGFFLKSLKIAQLTSGGAHMCTVTTEGAVFCWGLNSSGQVGVPPANPLDPGRTVFYPTRVAGLPPAAYVVTGENLTCAVSTQKELWCWGDNAENQISPEKKSQVMAPLKISGLKPVKSVIVSGPSTCVLSEDNSVSCWGKNHLGQLGTGDNARRDKPTTVAGLPPIEWITSGGRNFCAYDTNKKLWCWGDNTYGELGFGDRRARLKPEPVTGFDSVSEISIGWAHACAVFDDHSLKCWGLNGHGELGIGQKEDTMVPQKVSLPPVRSVRAGPYLTCALTLLGEMYCWGDNKLGELATGDPQPRNIPTKVERLSPIVDFSILGSTILARDAAGNYFTWGQDALAPIENRKVSVHSRPVPLERGRDYASLVLRATQACALTRTGDVLCWGTGPNGTLGLGPDLENTSTPKQLDFY